MFYGLASGKPSTPAASRSSTCSSDIETLNRAAFEGKYEVTAVSFHAYAHLADTLHAAAARREHGRPLRPDRRGPRSRGRRALEGVRVAIPGTLTTAYLALRLYEPDVDVRRHAVRPDPGGGRTTARSRPGCSSTRGSSPIEDEGLQQDRRPRRVVGRAHRRAAAAARRQRHPPRPRARDDRAASRGCCTTASRTRSITATRRSTTRMQFGRGLDRGEDRSLRRDVRERPDAGLRRRRPARRPAFLGEAGDKGLIPPGPRRIRLRERP